MSLRWMNDDKFLKVGMDWASKLKIMIWKRRDDGKLTKKYEMCFLKKKIEVETNLFKSGKMLIRIRNGLFDFIRAKF